jgi:inward rectifier potassium channel
MSTKNDKEDFFKETGFGNKVTEPNQRLMNKDGSSNVKKKGLSVFESLSFYHELITMPWWKFNLVVLAAYLGANCLFASLYYFLDIGHLNGMIAHSSLDEFLEAFFFSTQTISTVGFGRLNPSGTLMSSIAAIESMVGLLGFALATGLLYGRFSRPIIKLLFSENIIVAPYKNQSALMFRVANKRRNQLVEVEAVLIMSRIEKEDGKDIRKFNTLNLELDRISILSMTWTIVHPIDETSPLYAMKPGDFEKNKIEWIVMMKAFEETFSQTVHARTSYKHSELVHGAKFTTITNAGPEGSVIVQLDRIHEFEKVDI